MGIFTDMTKAREIKRDQLRAEQTAQTAYQQYRLGL